MAAAAGERDGSILAAVFESGSGRAAAANTTAVTSWLRNLSSSCPRALWAARSIAQLRSGRIPDIPRAVPTGTVGREVERRPIFGEPRSDIIKQAIYWHSRVRRC